MLLPRIKLKCSWKPVFHVRLHASLRNPARVLSRIDWSIIWPGGRAVGGIGGSIVDRICEIGILLDYYWSNMLSALGILWALLSVIVAGVCGFSFVQPFWFINKDSMNSLGMYSYCVRYGQRLGRDDGWCRGRGVPIDRSIDRRESWLIGGSLINWRLVWWGKQADVRVGNGVKLGRKRRWVSEWWMELDKNECLFYIIRLLYTSLCKIPLLVVLYESRAPDK